MIDIELEVRSTLAGAATTTSIPTFPGFAALAARERGPRRRLGAAAAVTGLILCSGVGVAAAASGVFTNPEPSGPFGYGVPGTERVVLRVPGPQGSTLTLSVADSRVGGYCSRIGGLRPIQAYVGSCGDPVTNTFGRLDQITGVTDASTRGLGLTEFSATVHGATSVRLSFDDGTSRSLSIAQDFTLGWFTDDQSLHHPELVGYDSGGRVIGRTDLIRAARERGVTCRTDC